MPMDQRHVPRRDALRVLGPLVIGVGLIFTVVGLGSFFSSFGSFEPPRYFWCAFVGLPILAVGVLLTKFAFLGAVTRYVANEVAPVGKDTLNYMAHGTKDAVREIASAVGQGLRSAGSPDAASPQAVGEVRCPACGEANDVDAHFCKGCGAALERGRTCGSCGTANDPDARFCDRCGQPL